MQKFSISISVAMLLAFSPIGVMAQTDNIDEAMMVVTPDDLATERYSAMIEFPKAYVSGVCLLKTDDEGVKGCIFNEFGISALEFERRAGKKKVKIVSAIKMINKWYIKRLLSRDLMHVLDNLQRGVNTYRNEKYNINYKFTPINYDATQE